MALLASSSSSPSWVLGQSKDYSFSNCFTCFDSSDVISNIHDWSRENQVGGKSWFIWRAPKQVPQRQMETANPLKLETVSQLLKTHFKDKKTKIHSDAIKLSAELLHVFILEAAYRSANQAKAEGASQVDIQHFEKILPKLLLDF